MSVFHRINKPQLNKATSIAIQRGNELIEKQFVHKLKKSSTYSYTITVPKEVIDKYDWREHQKFVLKDKGGGKLEISDWRKK